MALPSVGSAAPDFSLPDQDGKEHHLSAYRGQWVILYFYPKDDTPGCTVEACEFRDQYQKLKKAGVIVFGISADPVKSHEKFAAKFSLPFPLLADENKEAVKAYGVWGKKKFMGREFMGILRTTFLISPDGRIANVYEKVKAEGHAEDVMRDIPF
ncbi:thioredoxin-dependent thiol peroxidase [Candidatus Woesearchaeota archaeon]|nr:thioredoxin-dependent thiol peroxidase [Candidatus Woesearchaeota archaeon]